LQTR